jgi:starch synthase (maltosyl-transferring)
MNERLQGSEASRLPRRVAGRTRVVVEHVRPEVDGGRFPIKRTVGESVEVHAWIHADGHDTLAAVVRYRRTPDRPGRGGWLEVAMRPLGNDEWSASFEIEHQCPYEYTITAWVDRFASWRKELRLKVDAGQDVTSELREGAALLRAAARRARTVRAAADAVWLSDQAAVIEGVNQLAHRSRAALDDS